MKIGEGMRECDGRREKDKGKEGASTRGRIRKGPGKREKWSIQRRKKGVYRDINFPFLFFSSSNTTTTRKKRRSESLLPTSKKSSYLNMSDLNLNSETYDMDHKIPHLPLRII